MKKILVLILAITTSCNSLNATNPLTYAGNLVKYTAQEYAPSAYINWWCRGTVDQGEFYDAVKTGKYAFVCAALDHAKTNPEALKINMRDSVEHKTSLEAAIEHNQHGIFKTLLAHGAPSNVFDQNNLLTCALAKKNLYAAGMLLQVADAVAIKDRDGRSLLHIICNSGTYTPLEKEELIKKITQKDIVGDGSLEELKNYTRYDCVQKVFKQRLLQEMARTDRSIFNLQRTVNLCPQSNFTKEELYSAVYNQNTDAVELILALNPKLLEEKLDTGVTAFALAAMDNNDELVTYLQDKGAEDTTDKTKLSPRMETLINDYENKRRGHLQSITKLIPQYHRAYEQYRNQKRREISLSIRPESANQPYDLPEYYRGVLKDPISQLSRMLLPELKELHSNLARAHCALTQYTTNNASCCVCMEEYGQKSSVVLCKNNHTVCCGCFNSPTIKTCPLCRAELGCDKEWYCTSYCQTCSNPRPSLEFCYCFECQATTISCVDCALYPCCRKRRDTVTSAHLLKIQEHMQKYLSQKQEDNQKLSQKRFLDFMTHKLALPTQFEQEQNKLIAHIEQIKKEATELDNSLTLLKKELIEKQEQHEAWVRSSNEYIRTSSNPYLASSYKLDEHFKLLDLQKIVDKYYKGVDELKAMDIRIKAIAATLNKLPEVYQQKEQQLHKAFENEQNQLQKRYNKWLETINKMMPERI